MISKRSKGLFQRAILQSGSISCPWSFMKNPREVALKYMESLHCPLENSTELLYCLKTMDPEKLVKLQVNLMNPVTDFLMFAPSIELATAEDAFITENPRTLLKAGKVANNVPAIFGVVSGEGALRTARLEAIPESIQEIDANWESYAPKILLFDKQEEIAQDRIADVIRRFYFGNNSFTENLQEFKRNYSRLASDAYFFVPTHRAAKLNAKQGSPTYLYFYDYDSVVLPSMYSIFRAVREDDWVLSELKVASAIVVDWAKENIFRSEGPHEFGETHANDLFQLWNLEGISGLFAGPDSEFSAKFVKSFVDFAVNAEPLRFSDVPWPPIQSTTLKTQGSATSEISAQLPYMLLGTKPQVIVEPFADRTAFWESLRFRDTRKLNI